ncbi:XtrA/YqaO family protein [Sporolactobacillus terrae]|uniref:XtrA/YqaO family protein n=1 Tax=Sporolactobacillus terrae TaxID=269673 RepID=UPI000490C717|nr:XtrA/YqaO family protein [Sporolactobacillus terrae]
MRLKEMKIDTATMRLQLDIMELNNKVIVIGNGKAKVTDLPEHGETTIVTHQGKVKRVKWDEGEEF